MYSSLLVKQHWLLHIISRWFIDLDFSFFLSTILFVEIQNLQKSDSNFEADDRSVVIITEGPDCLCVHLQRSFEWLKELKTRKERYSLAAKITEGKAGDKTRTVAMVIGSATATGQSPTFTSSQAGGNWPGLHINHMSVNEKAFWNRHCV